MTSSHTNPDERDLLDFADAVAAGENLQPQSDLERTYLHVQHAMQGESGAIPADVKQSTWEDVMSTLSLAPEAPVSNRTRRERAVQAPTRRSRPKRIQWTPMQQTPKVTRRHFPLVAAVLLVFAIIGASFSTLVPDNESDDQFASVPPVVLGLSTPALISENDIPEWANCRFDHDVPVLLTRTDRFPTYDEGIRFNPDYAAAAVKCNDKFIELIIRENTEVIQTQYPGTVIVDTGSAISVLNIRSMRTVQLQTEMSLDEIQRFNRSNWDSRWLVIPDEDFVIDTQTMNVIALNGLLGTTTDQFKTVMSDASTDGDHLVLAIHNLSVTSGFTQIVTINATGQPTMMLTEVSPEEIQGLTLSPDATHIVYRSSGVQDRFNVVDLVTGEITDQFNVPADLNTSSPVWVGNGNEFVFANQGGLWKATLGYPEVAQLYFEPGTSLAIFKTRDPNMVTLVQQRSNTSQDQFEGTDAKKIITVNIATGDTVEYIGVDQTLSPNQEFVFTRNVILLETDPSMRSGAELHVHVIDPVTGEEVGRIDREDNGLRDGAVRSGGGTGDGDMRFYSWGSQHTYQVTTTEDVAILTQVQPPPGEASESDMAVDIRTAPDSSWIAMHVQANDEWWFLDLTDPDATWVRLPDNDGVYSIVLQP